MKRGEIVEVPVMWVNPSPSQLNRKSYVGIFIRYLTQEEKIMIVGPYQAEQYPFLCEVFVDGRFRTFAFSPKKVNKNA